jgi:Ribbon-helix-helix domain
LPLVFCTVAVYRGAVIEVTDMPAKNQGEGKTKSDGMPRASISFPPEIYKYLEQVSAQKKVSIAWVVREAVEKYLADQFPLFGTSLLKEQR